jgi:hypothetical protein
MSTAPNHTRRRWFSYSLRSLFVLITVASLPLVWVAYERAQSRRELQIVEQLKATYQNVELRFVGRFDRPYAYDSAGRVLEPSWWRRALSAVCGPRVEAVLASQNRSLSDISALAALRNLDMLSIEETQVSDISPVAVSWLGVQVESRGLIL